MGKFCFQMEEKPICRKKRQLVHLNRLQVAGRQKARSQGARSGPGSVGCPTDQKNRADNGLCPSLIMLVCRRPAWPGHPGRDSHRGPQPPDLDASGTSSPTFCCCSAVTRACVLLNKILKKGKLKPYGKPPWTAVIIWSFRKPK